MWDGEIKPVGPLLLTPAKSSIIIWSTCSLTELREYLNVCGDKYFSIPNHNCSRLYKYFGVTWIQ